jgi:hypothetical protein
MKSKLLQKKSHCLNKSRAGLDGQHENNSSTLTRGHVTPPNPINPAVDVEARKDNSCPAEAQLPTSQELNVLQQALQTITSPSELLSLVAHRLNRRQRRA